ncbi:MAG TPA: SpoVG family protein [Planctomycetaceae bacterium]|nr:SpoVG family protein [Planctomycetaceae bacterium]
MDITEVRIKLMDDPHERLQAFCSVTFDACFVIRDLKIIQGTKGPFVAMPSRKLTDRCPRCHMKNHLRALFCNQCGAKLDEERATRDTDGRAKLYADIAHPINSECRELIQNRVLAAYEVELVRANEPGYICTYDDYGEENYATLDMDEDIVPTFVSGNGESSHRIEPAAGPAGPHHRVGSAGREKASAGSAIRASDDDEPFGAGII